MIQNEVQNVGVKMLMTDASSQKTLCPWDLTDEAIAQVRSWLDAAEAYPTAPAAEHLASVLKDPKGLKFTVGFVDRVIRPEDHAAAAHALSEIAPYAPDFLPPHLRAAVRIGGMAAPYAPAMVVPVARRALRSMVEHLIVDVRDKNLGRAIKAMRTEGIALNMNLLGEAILGEDEAKRRVEGTLALIERRDVDYVSVKVSATVAPHNHWAFDEAVDEIVVKLRPLYRAAMKATPRTFINLDMEEYKDLDITLAVFKRLLSEEEFMQCEAGIVLQTYLPDSLQAMVDLQEFAAQRVAKGGARIKVRLVKGANLPMEQVQAQLKGWEQTVWSTKQESDTHYKAVLDYALQPQRLRHVRLGVAGHNLFDIALAWQLMKARGVPAGRAVEFEMLAGMASAQAQAVKEDVGSLLLYTPVVHPEEFDVAISYLVRRLEENASTENFMSAVFQLDRKEELFEREAARFRASLEALREQGDEIPPPRRTQNRQKEDYSILTPVQPFWNEPDTDPDLAANRAWGRAIIERIPTSTLGEQTSKDAHIGDMEGLDAVFETAKEASSAWQKLSAETREKVLFRMADRVAERRGDLLEVMGSETGKTLDQGDPEVSEAIDFCRYYGERGLELSSIEGATPKPLSVSVVTPPWNFPVAIPCGSITSLLAAGSAVIVKPAGLAKRCGAVLVECLWAALDDCGVSRDVVQLIDIGERELGKELVSDPRVDRLILTGGYETAQLFRRFRADLPLLAETSGKNAIIVTPSADLDLAPEHVVDSAFGHAGQKCSAASLVILVGSMAKSTRFRRQLLDAAASLHVGWPSDPRSQVGPVIEPPREKLESGLTELQTGEYWLLEPRPLDDSGRLFSPGIRGGVHPGSEFHQTEYFGPVLGVMVAETLEQAVEYANGVDYGLTSGIQSLDAQEISYWVEHIQAGNLYVNRGITGAIVQRQPFGGWKRSAVGAGTKAGGPNYLIGLSDWEDAPVNKDISSRDQSYPAVMLRRLSALKALKEELTWLRGAVAQDAVDVKQFKGARDRSALDVEINALRYRPSPVTIRATSACPRGLAEAARVVAAGLRVYDAVTTGVGTATREPMVLSLPLDAPDVFVDVIRDGNVQVVREDLDAWAMRAQRLAQATPYLFQRIRVVGPEPNDVAQATFRAMRGRPDVAVYTSSITSSGRIEMLPFVREQAVSMTAHRFGTVSDLPAQALGDIDVG